MTPRGRGGPGTARRILAIVAAVAAMVAGVLWAGSRLIAPGELPRHPPPIVQDRGAPPIRAESDLFRLHQEDLAMAPMAPRDAAAHARTLAFFRALREYPGAPPRIPHGLTAEEFRSQTCNNCHRRGGFVARFGDYARVTPHPDLGQCLQCHVPRDTLVGLPLPPGPGGATCPQCHVDPGARLPVFVQHDWVTTAWPDTGLRAMPGSPNLIPHGFQMRTSCLACHAGPEAVMGIRTDHPERISCRQCHVPAHPEVPGMEGGEVGPFVGRGGGEP